MPVNEKDRHVLAAAVAFKAQIIVTQNLRDFPDHLLNPFQIEAQSPDEFLVSLFLTGPEKMTNIVVRQAANLHKPPKTVYEVLDALNLHVPIFANLVRKELNEQLRNR